MLHGLTENHERSLLASVQYAARLIRDCDDVLAGSGGSDPLSRYTKALSAPQEKIARDYLFRLREQLLRALHAVGIQPPPASIGAVHALTTALMFLDDTFEEMRGRYLRGYGDLPAEAEQVLDGVVSEMQELTRDFETFLAGVSDDVLRERLERLAPANPVAKDLRELSRIIAEHDGLVDLRPSLAVLVDRALVDSLDVAVIGRVSSGKSSLLNALLGTAVLPTGVLPVTACPTRLRRGPEAQLHIAYANGRTETTTVDRIGEFVAESGDPGNEKRLTRVRDAWQPAVERAVDACLDVLRRWATGGLTRLGREFEGQSRPLLTQLTGAPTAGGAKGSMTTALQRDLEWLRQDREEMTHARD